MDKKFLEEIKAKLEEEKKLIEKELKSFANKDVKLKENWNTKYPQFTDRIERRRIEEAADEVEEYTDLLPIEHSLELLLRDINLALKKIKKGTYGKCEKCKKAISKERLKAYPEARFCMKCKR